MMSLAVVAVVSIAAGFVGRKLYISQKKGRLPKGSRAYFLKQTAPLQEEGLVRELMGGDEISICSINESMTVAFDYKCVNPRGLNIGFRLKGEELHQLLKEPTAEKLKQLGQIADRDGEVRVFAFEEQTIDTMRKVKSFQEI